MFADMLILAIMPSSPVGKGQVIKGWEQGESVLPSLTALVLITMRYSTGLLDMCINEKRILTIPSDLAYGKFAFITTSHSQSRLRAI